MIRNSPTTYIVEPSHFIGLWVCLDMAFKIDIVALFYVVRIQIGSHLQSHNRLVCELEKWNRVSFNSALLLLIVPVLALTMDHQPPLVLDCTVGDKRILRSACQVFSVVIYLRGKRQDAQRLIGRLRELKTRKVIA